jgi:putative transposase
VYILAVDDPVSKHRRRSMRLRGFDYSRPGAYYVTLCAQDKRCIFGEVVNGQMRMNDCGKAVHEHWWRSAGIRREITLDTWVVMPNHVHGIVWIQPVARNRPLEDVGADGVRPSPGRAPLAPASPAIQDVRFHGVRPRGGECRSPLPTRSRSLSSFVAGFKSATTRRINEIRNRPGGRVWQRNYYERVIRNEKELNRIREYIAGNPAHWPSDPENPAAATPDDECPWEW